MSTDNLSPWSVSGSYFEVCSCEAICPCRRSRGEKGGAPTYDPCDFALSWWIKQGQAGAIELAGLKVVMVGRWEVKPGNPWHVILYVDERATAAQKDAITAVFLGRAGGLPGRGFGTNIVEVHEVRSARDRTRPHAGAREDRRRAVPDRARARGGPARFHHHLRHPRPRPRGPGDPGGGVSRRGAPVRLGAAREVRVLHRLRVFVGVLTVSCSSGRSASSGRTRSRRSRPGCPAWFRR